MRIKYIGRCGNDLTTGAHYEAVETGASANLLTILADDADEEHTVPKHDCIVLDDRAAPADPRWADDDSIADVPAPCNTVGIEVIARDVVPELAEAAHDTPWTDQFGEDPIPEGPESTADLRQYRYTPDTY